MDYSGDKKVKVSQIKYLSGILDEFSEDLGKSVSNPAAEHLFQVRDESEAKFLPEEKAREFHHVTAQLLFLANRARLDIQTVVAFLTTKVKRPNEDDWGKLRRVLKYLKGTKYMKLTLTIDDLSIIKWWVDASDWMHHNLRGHTGSMMSLGGARWLVVCVNKN